MKEKTILKFLYPALVLLFLLNNTQAQENDTIFRGLRVGADISGLMRYAFGNNASQYAFSVDMPVNKNWYPTLEAGYYQQNTQNSKLTYHLAGTYFQAGLDHNLIGIKDSTRIERDMAYLGYRLCFSNYNQESSFYEITDSLWSPYTGSFEKQRNNAFWIQVTGGLKTELFQNFFLGWNVKMNIKIYTKTSSGVQAVYIPGFGKPSKNVNFGLGFSLYYLIPF